MIKHCLKAEGCDKLRSAEMTVFRGPTLCILVCRNELLGEPDTYILRSEDVLITAVLWYV